MSRLIIVSNRVARSAARPKGVGGLGSALSAALRDRGGLWFGWSGEIAEATDTAVNVTRSRGITYATVNLSRSDYEDYYAGFANQTIWPLFHFRTGLASIQRAYLHGYFRVNAQFARSLYPLLKPSDVVWVHDYHLIPLGRDLRKLGAGQRMGFFLHIPWPAAEVLYALPRHRTLVEAMFSYDLIGFQTPGDARSFIDYVVEEGGGELLDGHRLTCFGRTVEIGVFPIGCDAKAFSAQAESEEGRRHAARMKESIAGRDMILGVDRLDYSKGIDRRMRAFETLLKEHADLHRRVFMLQIAPASRSEVPEYQEIKKQLDLLCGQVNGAYADYDWVPLRYVSRIYSPAALASIYRASRVALVTPLRDGMNLVAKEFVACQDKADPGVLILSRFAGAAHQMREALIVNPFDEEEMADALYRALTMTYAERLRRWELLFHDVQRNDVHAWLRQYLNRLTSPPPSAERVGGAENRAAAALSAL